MRIKIWMYGLMSHTPMAQWLNSIMLWWLMIQWFNGPMTQWLDELMNKSINKSKDVLVNEKMND